MNNTARALRGHIIFRLLQRVRGENPPLTAKTGDRGDVVAVTFVACYTLNMGLTCNMSQKGDLSFLKFPLSADS